MGTFTAKLEGEKLILENKTTSAVFVREILIKYKISVETPDGKSAVKTLTDSITVNKQVKDKIEININIRDVVEVSVIYKRDNTTLREDISV